MCAEQQILSGISNCSLKPSAGIPTLIILDKQGELVNASGRAAIHKDPNGLVS